MNTPPSAKYSTTKHTHQDNTSDDPNTSQDKTLDNSKMIFNLSDDDNLGKKTPRTSSKLSRSKSQSSFEVKSQSSGQDVIRDIQFADGNNKSKDFI